MKTIVLDIETWRSNSFAFGVIWEGFNDYLVFQTAEAMRDHLLGMMKRSVRLKDRIRVIGHNIAYDLNWIFGNIELYFQDEYQEEQQKHRNGKIYTKKRYFKKILTREGRFYRASYWNLEFLDTFNLFPMSLKKAGQVVGYPKLETPDKFLSPDPLMVDQDDIEYCVRDCEVCFLIYEKIREFVEENNGKLGLTIASSGLSILKKFSDHIKRYLDGMNTSKKLQDLDEFFRSSYYGGRTEVFHREIENGYYYDINSLYPSVMAGDQDYPDPLTLRKFDGDLLAVIDHYEGVAEIEIEIPYMFIPPLPYRRSQKINYPYGRIKGIWNFPEIRQAIDQGCAVISAEKIIIGDRIKSPFKGYVEYLYNYRRELKEAGNPMEQIVKLFLNSVYGKFAQRSFSNKLVKLDDCDHFCETIEIDGELYVREITEPERSNCNLLSLASYVTSHARCELYKYLISCENVCYCDTDSIITTSVIPTSGDLGAMKLEDQIIYGSFKNRKDYYIETEEGGFCKRKGVSIKNLVSIDGKEIDDEIRKLIIDHDPYWNRAIHESNKLVYDRIIKSREGATSKDKIAGRSYQQKKERKMLLDDGREFDGQMSHPLKLNIDGMTEEEELDYQDQQMMMAQKYSERPIEDYKSDYWQKKKIVERMYGGDASFLDETLEVSELLEHRVWKDHKERY